MTNRSPRAVLLAILATLLLSPSLPRRASAAVAVRPKYGPAGTPYATPLWKDPSYFQSRAHPAPDFWALIGFYVPQFNGAACSTASLAMALNAARAANPGASVPTADDKLILQPNLVAKVASVDHYLDRIEKQGGGTTLEVLRDVAEAAFRTYGFPKARVEAIHVRDLKEPTLQRIRKALVENERSASDFILANFDQTIYTDDPGGGGHIAPVGAYDAEKHRVLILDPDREWYEPYWADEKRFIEGMNTRDLESADFRGYIWIQLGPRAP